MTSPQVVLVCMWFLKKHEILLPITSEKTWLQMLGVFAFQPPKK